MENIIIFGSENSNKETIAYDIIKQYSPSQLKYKRKIETTSGDNYNMSDIHFEIDFELLGTNESTLWVEFINHILDIVETKTTNIIILCKNIHMMKDELLQIMYTFMRTKNIYFIFTTNHISYLPVTLKCKCKIITATQFDTDYSTQYIMYCDLLIDFIMQHNSDLSLLRELLYNLLTYNCDIHTCFYYIFSTLINKKYIRNIDIKPIMKETLFILNKYNSNYRPIYHLESFIVYLISYYS